MNIHEAKCEDNKRNDGDNEDNLLLDSLLFERLNKIKVSKILTKIRFYL
jgi:hypothetical protein